MNQIKLFEFCSREDLESIADHCEFREFNSGEQIIEKGEPGDGMYMIDEGVVEVRLEESAEPVAEFGDGDYFGEMSILDNQPRSAHIFGSRSGRVLFFSKRGFQSMLPKSTKTVGKVMYVFARTLSRRLRDTNRQLRDLKDQVDDQA